MAEGHRMTAADLVDKLMADEHAEVLRDSVAWLVEELMNAEVTALAGAELGERAPDRRQTQRNGYRQRRWDTRVGELELAIPKLRQGAISRRSWSRAGGLSRPWSRWCRRPMSTGSRPVRSIGWSSSSGGKG
jgi:transposase-like protein